MNAPEPQVTGPMFDLKRAQAKLTSANARAEMHGQDTVPACDLSFNVDLHASALAQFDPDLPSALFKPDADKPQLVDGNLSAVRFPKLGTFKYDRKGSGYRIAIEYGIDEASWIKLGDVSIDGFRWDCVNGGVVDLSFRAIVHPDEDQMGKLCSMVGKKLTISLTPPEPSPDLVDQAQAPAPAKPKKSQPAPKDGEWPFPSTRKDAEKECYGFLTDRGFDVTFEFVRTMKNEDLQECIVYAKALADLSSTNAVPTTPAVLKGRYPKER